MKRGGGVMAACLIVLAGLSCSESSDPTADESDSTTDEAAVSSERDVPLDMLKACPTDARYRDRWPDTAAGGPSIGPITIAVGKGVEKRGLRAKRVDPGVLFAKMLILIDAKAGTRMQVTTTAAVQGDELRLDHFSDVGGWSEARSRLDTRVPDRGQEKNRPADIPGYVYASQPGCYALQVLLDGRSYGPFGLKIVDG